MKRNASVSNRMQAFVSKISSRDVMGSSLLPRAVLRGWEAFCPPAMRRPQGRKPPLRTAAARQEARCLDGGARWATPTQPASLRAGAGNPRKPPQHELLDKIGA